MTSLRHVVRVMRPAPPGGESSQTIPPQAIRNEVPCSIETMNARESERMQQMYAGANVKVEGHGDPAKRFKERDYLTGGSIGSRVLNIGFINDIQQNGLKLSLLCGERTGG